MTRKALTDMGHAAVHYESGDTLFRQGDDCEHVHYIRSGGVMVSVSSTRRKQAVIAMLGPGDFVGEACLAGRPAHVSTAVAIGPSMVMRIGRQRMTALLHKQHALSDRFITHVLTRNIRMQEDLTDGIFGAGEARLASALLRLAHYGEHNGPIETLPRLAEATLASMAGTTAARVRACLERFKRLGFVDYRRASHLTIHRSLLSVVLGE
jgi:CRP/FNR family transcriptional regulator, cyclic AMP receptor protein